MLQGTGGAGVAARGVLEATEADVERVVRVRVGVMALRFIHAHVHHLVLE